MQTPTSPIDSISTSDGSVGGSSLNKDGLTLTIPVRKELWTYLALLPPAL
ncbi:TPA: hypothetical protein ACGVB5_004369 [Vibrio vulnificus]|nr:hypothetical protein [Vibrio vulnificus]HAS6353065.1 hypothetical protein [Vibrio vulnificus]HAS6366902.1 hypothetical protein [Vibrio vulnificus]HDY7610770.1 hypothetical protein [Vibrio vulnificus]HDY7991496.1 hypothetical protein [Vibrio vulnificus]HDY8020921.1 hypothetical protein [Vibrio vulnificus]